MKPKSSSYARRSLTFEELPYAGKTFYIDVKSASAKSKITQRILSLGGQIENFLSKDLSLLITDKSATQHPRDGCSQKPAVGSVPLSRGQALLLKASANQTCDTNNNNNHGLLQSAAKLGVQIETPAGFLRQSSKLVEKVKAERPASRQEDCLSGMSTISWSSEKESCPVIKVEDEDGLYRPLFKQFDTFPQISYNETGCPFDVGVVLTKVKEGNQSKKKSVGGALRGGYCESCDHWYKCTLREHLNSDKHKEFVLAAENFKSLNQVTLNLPNLRNFVGKYGLQSNCNSPEIVSETHNWNNDNANCDSYNHNIQNRLSAAFERGTSEANHSVPYHENIAATCSVAKQTDRHRHASKTEPVLKQDCEFDVDKDPDTDPVRVTAVSHSVPQYNSAEEISGRNLQTRSLLNEVQSERNACKIKNSPRITKTSMSNKMGRKFSVDDVIKSVTENENYFSSGGDDTRKDFMSKTSIIITKHLTSDISTNMCSTLSNSQNMNGETGHSDKQKVSLDCSGESKKRIKEGSSRFKNLPAMCFSSSSCSFGDNGIGNVLSFLNSQQSRKSHDKGDPANGNLLLENDSVAEGSYKSGSSWALEMLTESKDDSENDIVDNGNEFANLNDNVGDKESGNGNAFANLNDNVGDKESGNGNAFANLNDNIPEKETDNAHAFANLNYNITDKENDMPVLEAVDESEKTGPDLDLMPVLESFDSEDLNKFCTSILNDDKVGKGNIVTCIGLPEYSNITEESVSDKLPVGSKHILEKNLQTNFEVPVLDFSSTIFKGVDTVETPDKDTMSNLKSKIYKTQANSGSTIRNWLLPNDDSASVRSVYSPGNLNDTLVNISCDLGNKLHADPVEVTRKSNDVQQKNDCLSNIRETMDSSKVADWIQKQDFIVTANACENSQQGFQDDIIEEKDFCSSDDKKFHVKDLKSCSERKFSGENEELEAGSNIWSDSGTSISDCTLDNFRTGGQQHIEANENGVNKEIEKEIDHGILNHDETSQDSGISAKTGLTSVVTAKGIKITGLSSLSSHFFNAAESDQFTESSTAVSDRKNLECSHANDVNKTVSDSQPGAGYSEQILHDSKLKNGCNQKPSQKCNTTALHISHSLNTNISAESYFQNSDTQQKKNLRCTKTNSSAKNNRQIQQKKARASKNTKSKKQTQSQNLLTQVLSSNLYSPVSSGFENSFSQSGCTDQENSVTSQTIPYCHSPGQSSGVNEFYQNQIMGQSHSTPMNSHAYSHNNAGSYSMMDLLLSPGHQVNSAFPQTQFEQNPVSQQQNVSFQTQQNHFSVQGACMPSLLTHQSVNHQFGVLPFPQVYQTHSGFQNNIDNSHHFLSPNSNFLTHNRHTGHAGSSVKQQNQTVHKVPESHWNYPASQGFLSHDHSNSNGSLQTIEMSHIADNSGGCESNFNFKIANTNKLKNGSTIARKTIKQKRLKANSTIAPVSSQQTICNSSFESAGIYKSEQLHNKTVYNGSNNGNQSPGLQSMPLTDNLYTSASINRPFENNSPYSTSVPASCVQQNNYYNHQQQQMHVNYDRSQNIHRNSQNFDVTAHHGYTDQHWNMYDTVQTGDTKLTFRRMPTSNLAPTCKQPKHNLMQYWNVRKAGDCRLVFSANTGKRKAEEEMPSKLVYVSHLNEIQNLQPLSKRQKCLIY